MIYAVHRMQTNKQYLWLTSNLVITHLIGIWKYFFWRICRNYWIEERLDTSLYLGGGTLILSSVFMNSRRSAKFIGLANR